MKKNIFIGALIAAVAVLLYFLLQKPTQPDSHKDDYDRVLADSKKLLADHADALKKVDSLETSGHAKDSVIAVLKADKKATEKELDKTTAAASRLAKEVKELSKGDTSELARKADSLAEQALNFEFLYNQYKESSDNLTAKLDSQSVDFRMALEEQKRLYAELKTQYDGLMKAYTSLFADVGKLQKTVKRERLKTKIAALLALIAGGAAVLK